MLTLSSSSLTASSISLRRPPLLPQSSTTNHRVHTAAHDPDLLFEVENSARDPLMLRLVLSLRLSEAVKDVGDGLKDEIVWCGGGVR
ncbi:hypothetical protein Tco_1498765 [Tanacetum coccineum]